MGRGDNIDVTGPGPTRGRSQSRVASQREASKKVSDNSLAVLDQAAAAGGSPPPPKPPNRGGDNPPEKHEGGQENFFRWARNFVGISGLAMFAASSALVISNALGADPGPLDPAAAEAFFATTLTGFAGMLAYLGWNK